MNETKHAVLALIGATCTSCTFAIEHMGEKLEGVEDIWVDRSESRIYVDYDGNTTLLDKICDFVGQIGYKAEIIASDGTSDIS